MNTRKAMVFAVGSAIVIIAALVVLVNANPKATTPSRAPANVNGVVKKLKSIATVREFADFSSSVIVLVIVQRHDPEIQAAVMEFLKKAPPLLPLDVLLVEQYHEDHPASAERIRRSYEEVIFERDSQLMFNPYPSLFETKQPFAVYGFESENDMLLLQLVNLVRHRYTQLSYGTKNGLVFPVSDGKELQPEVGQVFFAGEKIQAQYLDFPVLDILKASRIETDGLIVMQYDASHQAYVEQLDRELEQWAAKHLLSPRSEQAVFQVQQRIKEGSFTMPSIVIGLGHTCSQIAEPTIQDYLRRKRLSFVVVDLVPTDDPLLKECIAANAVAQ